MKNFIVRYFETNVELEKFFDCLADDEEDARNKCIIYHPEAVVIDVSESDA